MLTEKEVLLYGMSLPTTDRPPPLEGRGAPSEGGRGDRAGVGATAITQPSLGGAGVFLPSAVASALNINIGLCYVAFFLSPPSPFPSSEVYHPSFFPLDYFT